MTNVAAVPPDSYSQVIVWFHLIHVFVGAYSQDYVANQIFEYNPPPQ